MNTKEKIEVMAAHIAGKKIEVSRKGTDQWVPIDDPAWNWIRMEYRIAFEPKKAEGRWERKQIRIFDDEYSIEWELAGADYELVHLSRVNAMPGFGGIDYQSPFDPKVIVRSMVPLMFSGTTGSYYFTGYSEASRPGIPVAAWFWKEGEK